MKKSLFTLAAIATVMASCTSDDLLVDNNVVNTDTKQTEIGFSTFANKATRAENSTNDNQKLGLAAHNLSFAVWAYKNVSDDYVFGTSPTVGQVVDGREGQAATYYQTASEYNTGKNLSGTDALSDAAFAGLTPEQKLKTAATEDSWTYSPVRFWDKNATTYDFFAASPADQSWKLEANVANNHKDDYFKLDNVELNDATLSLTESLTQSMRGNKKAGDASSTGNIDLMIASPKSVTVGSGNNVDLDFNHILSRLNITVAKGTYLKGGTTDEEKLDRKLEIVGLSVKNLVNKGSFDESKDQDNLTASPADASLRNGTYARWDLTTSSKNDYTANAVAEVANDKTYYILQSLVMPQPVEFETVSRDGTTNAPTTAAYLCIEYKIGSYRYDGGTKPANGTSLDGYYTKSGDVYTKLTTGTADGNTTYYKLLTQPETFKAFYNIAGLFNKGYTYEATTNPTSTTGLYEQDATDTSKYNPTTDTTVQSGKTYYERKAGILAFNEGWQNTINLTIDVDAITFTANAFNWQDGTPGNN